MGSTRTDEPAGERVIASVPGPAAAGQHLPLAYLPLKRGEERPAGLGHAREEPAEGAIACGVPHRFGPSNARPAQGIMPWAQTRILQDRADLRLAVHALREHLDDELEQRVAGIRQRRVIEIQHRYVTPSPCRSR